MKKTFKLLTLFVLFASAIQAQTPIPSIGTDNSITSDCACLTFVSACNGEEINLYGSTVTFTCEITGQSDPYSVEMPIGSDGKICTELQNLCHDLRICVNSDNWRVCSVDGCEVQLYQEVPIYPTINSQQVGYGDMMNPGTGGLCGKVVKGPLNGPNTRRDIVVCDGVPSILNLPGMDLDPNSGLCLTVNLFFAWNGSNFLIDSETYDATEVNGSHVDITDLLNGLAGGFFKDFTIEFIISCCDGTPICTPGAQKWAYITLETGFTYSSYVNAGFFPNEVNFTPVTTGPGTLLPDAIFFPPSTYINQLTFNGFGVAPAGKNMDWEFWEVVCNGGSNTAQLYNGSVVANNPFSIGSLLLVNNDNDCHCYRLDLNYEDDCANGTITDSYYFKQGDDCPNVNGGNGSFFKSKSNLNVGEFELITNPIQNDKLRFNHKNEEIDSSPFELLIYNAQGQLIYQDIISDYGSTIEVPFSSKNGVYHYSIRSNNELYSGTFLKM